MFLLMCNIHKELVEYEINLKIMKCKRKVSVVTIS